MRKTRTWLIGITLAGMLAMLLAPAWALEIDFTTEANPNYGPFIDFTYRPSNLTPNAPGQSPNGPFSVTIATYSSATNLFQNPGGGITLRLASDNSVVPSTFSQSFIDQIHTDGEPNASVGTRLDRCTLTPNTALAANTNYYYSISTGMSLLDFATGTHSSLLPLDPRNSPYYNAGNNDFEIPFTTANVFVGSSTNIGGTSGLYNGGQTNVSINAVIKVTLSNALNASTVNTTNVVLHEGGASGATVEATVAMDSNDTTNKTIVVTPTASLKYATSYALILSNVADAGGQLLP